MDHFATTEPPPQRRQNPRDVCNFYGGIFGIFGLILQQFQLRRGKAKKIKDVPTTIRR
jgi:hypothetical protein